MIKDFFDNKIFFAVIIAWLVAQVFKFLLGIVVERRLDFERLFGGGGMPSGHSATVVTLAILVGYCYGYSSAIFAISGVLAIVVMYDAMGVRRETGKQAVLIKEFAQFFNDLGAYFGAKGKDLKTEKLKVLVGHTPLQVLFGALLGVLVSVIFILIEDPVYAALAI